MRIPALDARYWTAFFIASMCGTNLGDAVGDDVLHMSAMGGFAIFAVLFGVLIGIERFVVRGSEVLYWLTILIVRAAATNVADYSVGQVQLGYALSIIVFAVLLALIVATRRVNSDFTPPHPIGIADSIYWLTMLLAVSLATTIADGMGHAFESVQIGVPVSAISAAVLSLIVITLRARLPGLPLASYWTAVVVLSWCGTNVGDILAYVSSLLVSAATTAIALGLILLAWRSAPQRISA